MARIRSYREPIPSPHPYIVNGSPFEMPSCEYRDVFVFLEDPKLEFYQEDLAFLRAMNIDIFSE